MHNEGGKKVHESYIDGFLKKNLFKTGGPLWAQKTVGTHNSGSTLWVFLNFTQWKGPRGICKSYYFSEKKILFGENESFWTGQMVHFGLKNDVSL